MAITILSQPLNPIEPIFVEGGWNNSFTLNSTISNQCSMKYVGDLTIDGNLITRIKNSPNLQDGKCVITPWRILEDFVSGDRYLGETPIFQNCQDSQIRYSLRSWAPNANVIIHDSLTSLITYHSIVGTVSGTISGSDGATVSIYLQRANTGEIVLSDSRVGDGTYSFTWFDDTENILVLAHESNTKKGISKIDLMGSGDFDISLSSGGGGEYSYTWFG